LVLGFLSRGSSPVNGTLFGLLLLVTPWFLSSLSLDAARYFRGNGPVFAMSFYRVIFPILVQAALVLVPAVWGMRQGVRGLLARQTVAIALCSMVIQTWVWWRFLYGHQDWQTRALALLVYWPLLYMVIRGVSRRWTGGIALTLTLCGVCAAAEPPSIRASLSPANERKPAPEISLQDSSGKKVTLKKYRGKVVVLDFWATWCGGCKEEIPWFSDFERKYRGKGLAVVGVSLDEDGWKVVKPFLATARIPYRIVLGNDGTAKQYGIQAMPDTFLIDRQGRIAATYVGVVDRENIEGNIRGLLASR